MIEILLVVGATFVLFSVGFCITVFAITMIRDLW